MFPLKKNNEVLKKTIALAQEKNIIIPTFAQQRNPSTIPKSIIEELKKIGLWQIHPRNLFRITWKNQPKEKGGLFKEIPNFVEIPPELSGVETRIIALVGKWFPTGSHKVGATFGCLVPKLMTGQFDPLLQTAVWPSTGNFCRGGAYNATLLACKSLAILPEEMSRERFEWLRSVAGEIIATPGGESNVKEIFDKCSSLKKERGDEIVIFNQFDEFGNYLWHYEVTGPAMKEVLAKNISSSTLRGVCLTTGSAGTIGASDYIKDHFPTALSVVGESLQCPTMLQNGFGFHRIEGIGDKHIPWIHNVKNTDMVIAIDDKDCLNLLRLFNEPVGREYLRKQGLPDYMVENFDLLGISSIANLLLAIKLAKYYEMTRKDIILTVFTDSMQLYISRIKELNSKFGDYSEIKAGIDYHRSLQNVKTDFMQELTYPDKKRIHNLKYFTWIEQQGKNVDELNRQWYDDSYWQAIKNSASEIDKLILDFNNEVGLV